MAARATSSRRKFTRAAAAEQRIPLISITADPRAQPRVRLDAFAIDDYAERMRAGAKFPPVVVFEDGEAKRWLADGFHRFEAAKAAGLKKLAADIRRGGLREALLHAVGANVTHGLRRTNEDKRYAVHILLRDPEWGRWSNREIARRAAVDEGLVRKVRQELSADCPQMTDGGGRTVERGGIRYTMKNWRIGDSRRLDPKARKLLRNTAVRDDRKQVARLTNHPHEVQVNAAKLIEQGEARGVNHALKLIRYEGKVAASLDEVAQGRYAVILADPPWRFETGDGLDGVAEIQYPTMCTEEIAALPVGDKAGKNAILFLWTTNPHVPDALHVMNAWGWKYESNFCWDKRSVGMGFYVRSCHELLLIGVKGSLVPKVTPNSLFRARRGAHSVKPDLVYEIIESMYPGLPRLELFARRKRNGWGSWGNEPAAPGRS